METVVLSSVAHFAEFRLRYIDTALRMSEDSITHPSSPCVLSKRGSRFHNFIIQFQVRPAR